MKINTVIGLFSFGSVATYFLGYPAIAYALAYPFCLKTSLKVSNDLVEWYDKNISDLDLVGVPIMGVLAILLNGMYFYFAGKLFGSNV